MVNLTGSQRQKLRESYKRGIVRELYAKSMLTQEQYRRLTRRK
ncbi:MAG: hypothetical protein SOZ28_00690 [Clostridia bacterium]|nr:hypothetical protein [Clostridia bacterium]